MGKAIQAHRVTDSHDSASSMTTSWGFGYAGPWGDWVGFPGRCKGTHEAGMRARTGAGAQLDVAREVLVARWTNRGTIDTRTQ